MLVKHSSHEIVFSTILVLCYNEQARRRGVRGVRTNPPLEVNNGKLKTQTVDFQLLANSGGMENKL